MLRRVIGSAVAERGRVVMLARVADRAGGRKDAVTAMLVPGAGIFGATALHEDRERLNMPQGRSLRRSIPMDKFVAKANIEHYRRKLARETDETKRQVLARLLAEEEAKLASLANDPQKKPPHEG
jgi:hypothetical protein